jgi:hypothetical protein
MAKETMPCLECKTEAICYQVGLAVYHYHFMDGTCQLDDSCTAACASCRDRIYEEQTRPCDRCGETKWGIQYIDGDYHPFLCMDCMHEYIEPMFQPIPETFDADRTRPVSQTEEHGRPQTNPLVGLGTYLFKLLRELR